MNIVTSKTAAIMVKEGSRTGTTKTAVQAPDTPATGSSLREKSRRR